MKALRWYGIHDVRTEQIEKPVPGDSDVLIKIAYAGICGSDLHIYNKGMFIQNIPETMGHELSGTIEVVGSSVRNFKPGDRVIADPMVPCGTCPSCLAGNFNTCSGLGFIGEVRQGCFAEYIVLPEKSIIRLSDEADLRLAALTEPLAVAVNLCRRAEFDEQDDVAIIGAGPIGLLVAACALSVYHVHSVTVVNRSEYRRKIAEKLGAAAISSLPDDSLFDKVVEAGGTQATLGIALGHVKANGSVYPVSVFEDDVTIDANLIVCGQLKIVGSNCYGREELKEAAELIRSGTINIDPIITAEYDLNDGKSAFDRLCEKEKTAAKLLFRLS